MPGRTRRQHWVTAAAAMLAAAHLVACVPGAGGAPEIRMTDAATVELDLYSGRPNPSWPLSQADMRELAAILRGLPPARDQAPPDSLGYRGFVILGDGAALAGHDRLVVYRDLIFAGQDGAAVVLSDPGRSVERWLLARLGAELDPDLRRMIEAGGPP